MMSSQKADVPSPSGRGQIFRSLLLAALSFVLLLGSAGLALTWRGEEEMHKSDAAFHDGDLRAAVAHAKSAALAYVPGSDHVKSAYTRLEAIAKGAEAQGDQQLAHTAWEALRVCLVQTQYPGRAKSELEQKAAVALSRIEKSGF